MTRQARTGAQNLLEYPVSGYVLLYQGFSTLHVSALPVKEALAGKYRRMVSECRVGQVPRVRTRVCRSVAGNDVLPIHTKSPLFQTDPVAQLDALLLTTFPDRLSWSGP